MADKKKKLGRGLSALLGESNDDYAKLDQVLTAAHTAPPKLGNLLFFGLQF